MPEGDTIHRLAARLRPDLVGETVREAFGRQQGPLTAAHGERVEKVHARGKHLFIDLTGGWTIRVHLGIGGRCHQYPPGRWRGGAWSASLVIKTDGREVVFSKAPQARLERTAHVRAVPTIRRLGPDLLADEFDLDEVMRRSRQPAHGTRPIGELLLDQSISAGIGNVYKCEVLFIARLDPWAPTASLDDAVLRETFVLAQELLRANLRGGPRMTLREEHRRAGERFYVYRRQGRPCVICRAPIAFGRQGDQARASYYCPRCQRVTR